MRKVLRSLLGVIFLRALILGPISEAEGQGPPVNSTLVGTWNGYSGDYGDVWADGNTAYVGSFTLLDGNQARVHILDVTTPSTPSLLTTYFLPAPNQFRSPQDVKVGDGLLFIGMESGGNDLVEVVDVRDPSNPVKITSLQASGFDRCHNTFYDNGFLYVVDSNTPRVLVYDLRTLDPDNPPAGPITTPLWQINNVGSVFVHDVTVSGGRLYAAGWDSGLFVYDVGDVANTAPVLLGNVDGNNTHSMWPTADGNYVVTGEERGNGGITVYRVTDGGGSISFEQTDSLVLSDDAFSVHNQVMVGNRLFVSWYQAGLQVFDINSLTGQLEFIASYDTSAFGGGSGFQGAWGVYPFLGEESILVSDIEEGFFVISVQGPLLAIDFPLGLLDLVDPNGGSELRVEVTAEGGVPDTSSGLLFTSIDGGPFTASPMSFDGAVFVGTFPTASCGSDVAYYVSVDTLDGDTVTSPQNAPALVYSALAAVGLNEISAIDFETDPGWTISGDATDGQWELDVPIPLSTCDRGNPGADFDGSGSCFLTDNDPADCNSDVDGGTTTLTTGSFNLTGLNDPRVSYARWYSNNSGAGPNQDTLEVEVSNNGGASWDSLETVGPSGAEVGGGWLVTNIPVSDAIALTNDMVFRFHVSDLIDGSVVEAGLDAFKILALECSAEETPATVTVSPQPQSACEGDDATFAVIASGTEPITYQWRLDGVDIPFANSSSYTVFDATPADAGVYTCLVTNAFGSDVSDGASLSVVTLASCDDGNGCTADSCASSVCVNVDDTPAGQCCDPASGGLVAVDDNDACTDDTCNGDGSVDHVVNYDVATECCTPANGQTILIDDASACTNDTCNADGTVDHVDNYDSVLDCCDPATGGLTTIDDGNDCSQDTCNMETGEVTHTVLIPSTAAIGGRRFTITPQDICADAVALVVTAPTYPCLERYVDVDGTLTDTAVFQTPAAWSAVVVVGEEIVSESTYHVQAELPGGERSLASSVTTWLWGDIDNNGIKNLADVQLIVLAFQSQFDLVTLEQADIEPCTPNGIANFADILLAVLAFQGQEYAETGCPIPCE